MMVKLKPGRQGLMRNGEVTGVLCFTPSDSDPWSADGLSWDDRGRWLNPAKCHENDIIALIPKKWKLHTGIENPAPGSMVKVMFRDVSGNKQWTNSSGWWWGDARIIAYKVKRKFRKGQYVIKPKGYLWPGKVNKRTILDTGQVRYLVGRFPDYKCLHIFSESDLQASDLDEVSSCDQNWLMANGVVE